MRPMPVSLRTQDLKYAYSHGLTPGAMHEFLWAEPGYAIESTFMGAYCLTTLPLGVGLTSVSQCPRYLSPIDVDTVPDLGVQAR